MNTFFNSLVKSLGAAALAVTAVCASPAWAETPQTDVAFIEQMGGASTDEVLDALALYYDLHVSELAVQLNREQNTGAFLAARRAENDGDTAEAQRQTAIFENTREALAKAREENMALRQELAVMTDLDFGGNLAMAPDAPFDKPAPVAGAPGDLAKALDDAWTKVEAARAALGEMRLKLLEVQERYDTHRDVSIGDAMRAMTKAEVDMARAATDFRLIEAKIAAVTGQPLAGVLGGL